MKKVAGTICGAISGLLGGAVGAQLCGLLFGKGLFVIIKYALIAGSPLLGLSLLLPHSLSELFSFIPDEYHYPAFGAIFGLIVGLIGGYKRSSKKKSRVVFIPIECFFFCLLLLNPISLFIYTSYLSRIITYNIVTLGQLNFSKAGRNFLYGKETAINLHHKKHVVRVRPWFPGLTHTTGPCEDDADTKHPLLLFFDVFFVHQTSVVHDYHIEAYRNDYPPCDRRYGITTMIPCFIFASLQLDIFWH